MDRILTIIKKEFIDLTRDRRTMFFMFVFPLLITPLLIIGIPKLVMSFAQNELEKDITVAIVGDEIPQDFLDIFNESTKIIIVENVIEADFSQLIKDKVIDIGLVVNKKIVNVPTHFMNVDLKLYFQSEKGENFSKGRINRLIKNYSEKLKEDRFNKLNINKSSITPINVENIDVASDKEKLGKSIGTFLPYIFIIFCFSGALYPALDLGAGEKERRTLETILTSSATHFEIIVGKITIISLFGMSSAIFALLGMLLTVQYQTYLPAELMKEILEFSNSIITLESILLIFSLLIPIALFFGSFFLAASFYAKTFKEAQSILGPINMIILIPIILATLPGITLKHSTAWIPILNVSLAMNDIISGTITPILYAEVLISLLAFTMLSIIISIKFIGREEVIFRG